jgi:hypothetical protein
MPPGRRQWVFKQVGERLPETASGLRALAAEGAATEGELLAFMLKFRGDQSAKDPTKVWPRQVVELDAALDRQVGNLHDLTKTMVAVYGGKPEGALWVRLQQAAFPAGAAYYTTQPYIEEAARVKTLLLELGSATWASLTASGVVAETVAAVTEAHSAYSAEVSKFDELDKVTWDRVKALDLANHRRLCALVAGIVAGFTTDAELRKRLLAPVAQQDQEVYEALRARRRVLDVDPDTGEPIAPVAPAPADPPPQ